MNAHSNEYTLCWIHSFERPVDPRTSSTCRFRAEEATRALAQAGSVEAALEILRAGVSPARNFRIAMGVQDGRGGECGINCN